MPPKPNSNYTMIQPKWIIGDRVRVGRGAAAEFVGKDGRLVGTFFNGNAWAVVLDGEPYLAPRRGCVEEFEPYNGWADGFWTEHLTRIGNSRDPT